jgi:hypothetical protein
MKRITGLLMALCALAVLVSCGTASRLPAASKEDKDLFKAIEAINKSNHAEARKDLPGLYSQAVQRHEDKISNYKNLSSPDRWQGIVSELEALQRIYTAVKASRGSAGLVSVNDYSADLGNAKESGAAEFYDLGLQYLESGDRQEARKAYNAFQSVNKMYPNYKDTRNLLNEAREQGTLDVVINPVQSMGYSYSSFGFRADNFQRSLVRDLGGSFGNAVSGARFYTDMDARSRNAEPDWIVDLSWNNVYPNQPYTRTYNREVSKEIEVGKDSSGRVIYKTVTATLHITQRTLTVRANMEFRITDYATRKNVQWSTIPAYLDLNEEFATYRGDSRALSSYDWQLVNNRRNRNMDESEIMDALYARVYPDVRQRIETATRW